MTDDALEIDALEIEFMAKFGDAELHQDLVESLDDAKVCEDALWHGVRVHNGIDVQSRYDINLDMIQRISRELARRRKERL